MKAFLLLVAPVLAAAQGVNTTITCSQLVDGSISPSNPGIVKDFYHFDSQEGDSIALRIRWASTDPSTVPNLTVTVTDQSGHMLNARPPSNANPTPPDYLLEGASFSAEYDISVTGTSQIAIQNLTAAPITYRLTFVFLNRSCTGASLSCGAAQQGSITNTLQTDSYQFAAKAGDQLLVRLARTGNQGQLANAAVLFYSPTGQYVGGFGTPGITSLNAVTTVMPADGNLTLLVFDQNNSTEGYVVSVAKLNGGCGTKSLTCGAVNSGSVAAPLAADSFSITASPGDVISVRAAAVNTSAGFVPLVLIFDSQGNQVPNQGAGGVPTLLNRPIANATFSIAATQTSAAFQAYTAMVVDNSNTGLHNGSYAITLVRLNHPCPGAAPLACGQSVNDSLQGLLASKSYSITANANDKFQLRLLNNTQVGLFTPHIEIYDSLGNSAASPGNVTSLAPQFFSPTVAGTYTLLMTDGFDGSQSGSYIMSLLRLNGPCNAAVPKLTCGAAAPGSFVQPLDSPEFVFNAAPGQSFSVRLIDETGALQPSLSVYDPQGNSVGLPVSASYTGVDVAQAAGGLYTIVAQDNTQRQVGGPITVDLVGAACAAPAPQGQTVTGAVNASRPFDGYSFQANAGDMLSLRSVSVSSGFIAQMDLYDPNGQRLSSASGQMSQKLSTGGTYTVIVGPSAARTGGGYSLAWQLLNNPAGAAPLTCGGSVAASLTPSNQYRYYTANASAGDVLRLIFTRLSDNFSPQVELYDPTGARLAQTSDILQKAAAAGSYLVIVSPSTISAQTGTYNLAFQRPNNPCSATALTCGQTALQMVSLPGQLDAFTFTGTASHQADVKLVQRTGNYTPLAELYDSSGNRLQSSSSGGVKAILASSGTYALLVRDLNAVNTGSYRVSLQDDTSACTVSDTQPPVITMVQPTGGEVIPGGLTYHIQWQSDDNVGVASHDVALSTDGGQTFPTALASGLSGNTQAFDWTVPPNIAPTRGGVVRVTATDAAGNQQSAASGLVTIIGSGFQPNNTTTLSYDSLNRLTQAVLNGGVTIQYTWDAAGNLVQIQISGQ